MSSRNPDVFEEAAPAAHRVDSDRITGSLEILLAKPTERPRDNGLGRVRDDWSVAIGDALFGAFIFAQKRGRARLLAKPDLLPSFDTEIEAYIAVPVGVFD
jgi:hypothetical protein